MFLEGQGKGGPPAGKGLDRDSAAIIFDDLFGYVEPEARSFFPGRKEGFEDLGHFGRGDPAAGVLHLDFDFSGIFFAG